MNNPKTCRAAVYDPDQGPGLKIRELPLRPPSAGCIYQGANANLDLGHLTTHLLKLIGLHNYTPADLQAALTFLINFGHRFAFDKIIAETFPLNKINQSLDISNALPSSKRSSPASPLKYIRIVAPF